MGRLMNMPLVTILLPVYNSINYIDETMQSLLTQHYQYFELLVIDDCSTDGTWAKLKQYAAQDDRIKLFAKKTHSGYTTSLNIGTQQAQGKYIARLDADDVALPQRLATQVNFLEHHLAVGVCGSWAIDYYSGQLMQVPQHHQDICAELLFHNCLIHPTIMLRTSLLKDQGYNADFEPSEDYHLWQQLSRRTILHNLNIPLVKKRNHVQQVSQIQQVKQKQNALKVSRLNLKQLNINPNPQELEMHYACTREGLPQGLDTLQNLSTWLLKLYQQNQTKQVYPTVALGELLAQIWDKHTAGQTPLGMRFFQLIKQNPLSAYHQWSSMQRFRFWLKCVLKH